MDAYDIQQQLKAAWANIFMQMSHTDNLNKYSSEVPVYVVTEDGKEQSVTKVKVQDNRIYLELK